MTKFCFFDIIRATKGVLGMILKNDLKNISIIQALSLDIDDTLIRYLPVQEYLLDVLKTFDLPYSKDVMSGYFNSIRQFEDYVLQTGDVSSDTFAKFLWENIKILRQNSVSAIDFKNCLFAKEAKYTKTEANISKEVELLNKYYRLFCYTKWFRENQQRKLIKHDILEFFEKVYSFEDDNTIKTTEGFEKLANDLKNVGINKNEFIHIGDSRIDIEPCESVGIQSVLIDYNKTKEDLYPLASAVITEFSDLKKVLLCNK